MAAKIAGRINSAFCKCDEGQRTLSKHVTFCENCNDPACHCMEWHVMISAADGGSTCAGLCRGSLVQGSMRPGSDFMTRQAMPSDDTGLHPGPLILHILCLSATILHALLPVMPVGMGRSPGLASKGHSLTASVCWVAGVTVRPRLQACPQPQGKR